MTNFSANPPAAANPATTFRGHAEGQWRRFAERNRSVNSYAIDRLTAVR